MEFFFAEIITPCQEVYFKVVVHSFIFQLYGLSEKRIEKRLGMLKFNPSNQDLIVRKLVTDLNPEHVEKAMPGLPAHIMFMSIRYIDHVNQERLMQSYLTAIISSIKRRATELDIDNQAFWLANTYRLYCDMKQFSGDQVIHHRRN